MNCWNWPFFLNSSQLGQGQCKLIEQLYKKECHRLYFLYSSPKKKRLKIIYSTSCHFKIVFFSKFISFSCITQGWNRQAIKEGKEYSLYSINYKSSNFWETYWSTFKVTLFTYYIAFFVVVVVIIMYNFFQYIHI